MKPEDPVGDCVPWENIEDTPLTKAIRILEKENYMPFKEQFLVCEFGSSRDKIVDHETVHHELGLLDTPPNHKII